MLTDYANRLLERGGAASALAKPSPSSLAGSTASPAPAPAAVPAALAAYPVHMRARQVADYLSISKDQVMHFRDQGELEFLNVACPGARRPSYRITRASVAEFEHRRQTAPPK
jgi:hypothetical protein